jgi:hypothetical protein
MPTWFTVRLADRPGSLAQLASALGEAGVNITGIVGVAEDTNGTLMLTTSDPAVTRATLSAGGVAFEEHDSDVQASPGGLRDVRSGLAARGLDVNA